ncbi:MAG: HAD family hydrolase [Bacillales bacterium]|nr:HAD family hydrolase [Bacillales bacterium]
MKKALFFDLDGTLWDALIPLTKSWNEAMLEHHLPYRFDLEKMRSYMGLTPEETCPLAFPNTTLEEGLKLFKIVLDAEILFLAKNPGILYENEENILSQLSQKYPLYIVSNADKGYIQNYINACNMSKYFTDFVQAGDTNLPKWRNILYMKEKENIDEVIYIGDTKKDMDESFKAGVKFIHAAYGFGKIDNAQYKISSLNELPSLVDSIFKD